MNFFRVVKAVQTKPLENLINVFRAYPESKLRLSLLLYNISLVMYVKYEVR